MNSTPLSTCGALARLAALIFDLDGTLAETEELHRLAFNGAFAEAGLNLRWEPSVYRPLLNVTGGKRRIVHFFEQAGLPIPDELASALHSAKNRHYGELVARGAAVHRPGVLDLLGRARAKGLRIAIATTTSRVNLDALLVASPMPAFDVLVSANDVSELKPHPAAYLVALERLGLAPAEALAFEDSENGLRAAVAAGLRTIVTPAAYTVGGDFRAATEVRENLTAFDLGRWD